MSVYNLENKNDSRKENLERVPWWRTLISLSVSSLLFMQRYFLSECVPSARNWGLGLLALVGGWVAEAEITCVSCTGMVTGARLPLSVWGPLLLSGLQKWHSCQVFSCQGKKKKSICPSLILALASLCPVPAHYSQCSACLTQFWRPAAWRVNKSLPVGLLVV